jgi:hypothetical protein
MLNVSFAESARSAVVRIYVYFGFSSFKIGRIAVVAINGFLH